ncbi:MAG: NAD(+)/NADH kinase [Clostridia bacterium]|nr:NAD(+)/NADH kinase [Clostridia bacterium]
MTKIGVFINQEKDTEGKIAEEIVSAAKKLGADCSLVEKNQSYDFVISVGGDGTFLGTARKFMESGTPIVGVNLGNLGYLTEISKEQVHDALAQILAGNYTVEERILLEAEFLGQKMYALNDIVVSRGIQTKLLELNLFFDGKFVDRYRADGLILATPTGSTAYSLSSGGPIAEPALDVLLVTPICAHSLYQRPIIVRGDTEIRVETPGCMVVADGQELREHYEETSVIIRKSEKTIKLMKLKDHFFFDTVRKKFMK